MMQSIQNRSDFVYLLLLCWILGVQCQSQTVKKEVLFGDFYIRYLKEERLIRAEAAFFQGDSLKRASPFRFEGHTMLFQNKPMRLNQLAPNLIRYETEQSTKVTETNYTFTSTAPNSFNFTCSLPRIDSFYFEQPIDKEKGTRLHLSGIVPEQVGGYKLIALFGTANHGTHTLEIPYTIGQLEIPLEATSLNALPSDSASVYLVFRTQHEQGKPQELLHGVVEYYTDTQIVEITKGVSR